MELATRGLDNDTRGWIMCVVSGIACIFGASIVCVDFIVRLFPGKRNFRIQESNIFLACSLSLSFGVMMFSALYSMLPESRDYLKKDAWADQPAGFVVMGCFIAGFFGIQAVSRLLHRYMPSHVVDCDHTHDDAATQDSVSCNHDRRQSRVSRARRRLSCPRSSRSHVKLDVGYNAENGVALPAESTPLLPPSIETDGNSSRKPQCQRHASTRADTRSRRPTSPLLALRSRATTGDLEAAARRPSMYEVQKRVMSFVRDTKCNCDEEGSCYGYTDPCGQECFKHLSTRSQSGSRHPVLLRTTTGPFYPHTASVFQAGHGLDDPDAPISPRFRISRATSRELLLPQTDEESQDQGDHDSSYSTEEEDLETSQHHHHVPTNAFLSIGLQTSIAIALHKFPEGFITYATNHANPTLGFNVFMALFVHNISEGFAMCLPLYMALGSRWRAIAWSAVLGGMSQPMGAGAAALWFKLAQRSNITPNAVVYACLFAITSGIMVSVALQLFVEGLSLNHNRNLCIFFGFLGMAVLGVSNALFAAH
ncbi:vacuolar Zn-iron permease [Metarhizium rileyi]|uniref:Vacuolar Zn-iron permease n=1 Tax=Metarhizium rileyi (strain RCEF 4871) TaxID=1649241 RepID=A0A167JKU6_METRR|nr:vacuolar Zn-iron permease [Metarhizium rileyi RCEF 4871]